MPAMTNLLIKDDAATPKEWTFIPVTDNPNPQWRSNDAALPLIGQLRLSSLMEKTKTGWKISAKLEVPVLETLGASGTALGYVASPKVAHVVTGIFTMFADERSTISDRANLLRLMVGFLQGASSVTNTGGLVNSAAGDSWKGNTQVGPQMFTVAIQPN